MKKTIPCFIIMILFIMFACKSTAENKTEKAVTNLFAVARTNTPVLYTSDFDAVFGGSDGVSLKFDDYGEIDELEFIALPGTAFTVHKVIEGKAGKIYQVTTNDYNYPTEKGYYVDGRFIDLQDTMPAERKRDLPEKEAVIAELKKANGAIYTWGGNVNGGIPELLEFYPPKKDIPVELKDQWALKGADCSGLLYEATNGYIPRNTSDLVSFGDPVAIEGLSVDEIQQMVQPLDIIVWRGHLIVVLDKYTVIQSSLDYDSETEGFQGGVKISEIKSVLTKLLEKRTAVDDYNKEVDGKKFVIRRWFQG